MLTHRVQIIHARRNVICLNQEHYVQDYIDARLPGSSPAPFPTHDCAVVLVPDTETVLNQVDALQHHSLKNFLFLETVYEQVKTKSRSIQNRVDRLLRETERHFSVFANEHFVTTWIDQSEARTSQAHRQQLIFRALDFLQSQFPIVYLMNCDRDVQAFRDELGREPPYSVMTIHRFAEGNSDLAELLTAPDRGDGSEQLFEAHLSAAQVHELTTSGRGFIGLFSLSRLARDDSTVRTQKYEIIVRPKRNQNRAIDGDTVAVELLPETEFLRVGNATFPTGKVVAILKSAQRVICGTIQAPQSLTNDWQNVLVVPMDVALPKIRIRTRKVEQLLGCRIQVVIDGWSQNSKYPSGHCIATIGQSGDRHTESEVILLSRQIPHDNFPPAVLECLPPDDYQPSAQELATRRDLRDRMVVSIDPPGCTDIDDALHARRLSENECEIGVHIADVSYFVREGTTLDLEARERGTSVYLVEKRINMLPGLLSENLCSLMGGVERFAFSVVATLDINTAETKDIWFGRTVIRNRDSMSYQKAQRLVDDASDHSEITESIRMLLHLSRIMRAKRLENGALKLSSPQLHFHLDSETQEPLSGELYEHEEVNSLVEEFMLYANIEVARRIWKDFPQSAMLRRHESPLATRFDSLNRALKRFNMQLDLESNKSLTETLDAVAAQDPNLDGIVRMLTTRCMQRAQYFAAGTQNYDRFAHYGLAMPIYTHFTSPIRRYCDLIVHRQLAIAVGCEAPSDICASKQQISAIADNLNFRHCMAQEAGRDSSQLFMMEMLRKTPNRIERGKVTQIKPTVFVVLLEQFGVEGHVHVDGEKWSFSEQEETLSSGSVTIRIFDTIPVRVNVTPMNMHGRSRLDLEPVFD